MFAIIKTGGKQYKLTHNTIVIVEKLDHAPGEHVVFDKVLMIGDDQKTLVGSAALTQAKVLGVVVNQDRADKVIIFKKTRRHTYRRKKGHRQHQTVVRIMEIAANGVFTQQKAAAKEEKSVKAESKAPKETSKKEEAVKKVAPKKAAKTDK